VAHFVRLAEINSKRKKIIQKRCAHSSHASPVRCRALEEVLVVDVSPWLDKNSASSSHLLQSEGHTFPSVLARLPTEAECCRPLLGSQFPFQSPVANLRHSGVHP
jgi:hypothetical protein